MEIYLFFNRSTFPNLKVAASNLYYKSVEFTTEEELSQANSLAVLASAI